MNIAFSQNICKNHPLFIQISELTFNEKINDMPITSTGDCYLVFAYGTFTLKGNIDVVAPKYYITPIDNAYRLSAKKGSSFIAIRLNPDRFKVITNLDTVNYVDHLVNLNTVLPNSLCENLWLELKENTFSDYENSLNNHLDKYLNNWSKPSIITNILNYIHTKNGMLDINELLNEYHLSHSTLNRYFKIFIGHTPNKFIRLIRFNYIIRQLEANSDNVKNLIIDYQYYDYSHFAKDFKLFTGQSPKEYQGANHELLKEILFKKVNY